MNRLLELCLPRLLTREQYLQRLDEAGDIPVFVLKPRHLSELPNNLSDTAALQTVLLAKLRGKPPVKNKPTGSSIAFFRAGIQSSLKSRSVIVRKLYMALPEMLEIAIPDGFETNDKRDKKIGISGYKIFKIYVQDEQHRYLVKIKVDVPDLGEDGQTIRADGYYYHGIEEIKQMS
ncbi:hypothetical protein FK216_11985 [Moraxellaceae bacterium AER2_44_116]|nr:hypothetical protein FK216_11985 [Moraxellaceae bacterium AER2_44_116]